jgi:hypothetical protein
VKAERWEKPKLANILLTGAVVIGWAIWRVIRGEPIFGSRASEDLSESSAGRIHAEEPSPALPSLSKGTPGRAPLDQLVRTASAEENGGINLAPNVSAPTSSAATTSTEETAAKNEGAVLAAQSLASVRIPGWNQPTPDRLPVPTFAPAIMAMGIVVFAMGIVTTWYVCVVGAMVFAVATWRWVGELQGE